MSVEVTNSGRVTGDEVVQLYLRDDVASITRPVKGAARLPPHHLEPGESRTVTFVLRPSDLSFYGPDLRRIVEPGTFTVFAREATLSPFAKRISSWRTEGARSRAPAD